MTWRGEIMGLAQSERLPAALDLIGDLLGGGSADRAHWRLMLGLPPAQALIFGMLWARPGQLVTAEALLLAMDFDGYEASEASMKMHVSHLRASLRRRGFPLAVAARWGAGYALTDTAASAMRHLAPDLAARHALRRSLGDLPAQAAAKQGTPWTDQDDADLRLMVSKGDARPVIAYELERSESAILDRLAALGFRAGVIWVAGT